MKLGMIVLAGSAAMACVSLAQAAPTVVNVGLADDAITPSQATIPAGMVTFVVKNDSMVDSHEMVVLKAADQSLPFDAKSDRVKEGKVKSVGEVSDLAPGGTKKLAVNLKPGVYALICNIKGHYKHGMHTEITVQ